MQTYEKKEIASNFLRFFAMEPDAQLEYAKGIPLATHERGYPLGLQQSPLLELADCARGINMSLIEVGTKQSAIEVIDDLAAVLELIACANDADIFYGTAESLRTANVWRLVRKLSRECLREFDIDARPPEIDYLEFLSWVMD